MNSRVRSAKPSVSGVPKSFFLVLANDLPKTFRGGQTCCAVVVGVGDAGMGMVQKCAGEIGVLAAADGGGRCGATAKQVRAYSDTYGCEGGGADHLPETTTILNWRSVVAAEPES